MLYNSAPVNKPLYDDPRKVAKRDFSSVTDEDPYVDIPDSRFFTGYDNEARGVVEEMFFEVWGSEADSLNVTTDVDDSKMESICRRYETKDSKNIKEFLNDEPHLLDVLNEAFWEILVYFGDFVAVTLEVVNGIEGETDPYLRVGIISCDDVGRLLRRLEAFDEGWWLSKLPEVNGDLIFNLDF